MNYLLDTHVFLWWLVNDPKLSTKAHAAIKKETNTIFVSAASIWEISIKKALGKLTAPNNFEDIIEVNDFHPLVISMSHAQKAGELPPHHDDPFDRMLIAQAQIEDFTMITHDPHFKRYKVKIL